MAGQAQAPFIRLPSFPEPAEAQQRQGAVDADLHIRRAQPQRGVEGGERFLHAAKRGQRLAEIGPGDGVLGIGARRRVELRGCGRGVADRRQRDPEQVGAKAPGRHAAQQIQGFPGPAGLEQEARGDAEQARIVRRQRQGGAQAGFRRLGASLRGEQADQVRQRMGMAGAQRRDADQPGSRRLGRVGPGQSEAVQQPGLDILRAGFRQRRQHLARRSEAAFPQCGESRAQPGETVGITHPLSLSWLASSRVIIVRVAVRGQGEGRPMRRCGRTGDQTLAFLPEGVQSSLSIGLPLRLAWRSKRQRDILTEFTNQKVHRRWHEMTSRDLRDDCSGLTDLFQAIPWPKWLRACARAHCPIRA
ncbi:protein of unknown function [Rhodovastum atsumiense]|nr:protein of unknown function [Rhodovastum atsumiense]